MTPDPASGSTRTTVVGYALPEDRFRDLASESPIILAQTQAFGSQLVQALQSAGHDVQLISFAPAANYPEDPRLVFWGEEITVNGAIGRELGFINVLGLKHITRYLQLRRRGLPMFRESRPHQVVVHGVHTPLLRFALLLRRRFGVAVIAVLTDPAGVVREGDGFLKRMLRRIDERSAAALLRQFDGIAALTPALAERYAAGIPATHFPGFAPEASRPVSHSQRRSGFTIAYAGGLVEDYGVGDLVRAFRKTSDPDLRLEIYGRGPLAQWVTENAEADSRITLAFLDREQLLVRLQEVDGLVNPRRLSLREVDYTFPSKLLEFATLGVPTISTPLPTIPAGLRKHLMLTEADGEDALLGKILELYAMAPNERTLFGAKAREFVLHSYGVEQIGRQLSDFIKNDLKSGR